MKYIVMASELNYGLTIREVKSFAYQFAELLKTNYPKAWDTNKAASKDWYYAFMHRHPLLSLRTPEQISANRAKAFCPTNVKIFFDNLSSVLSEEIAPHRIWNMDETGCPTVPTKTVKVVAKKVQEGSGNKHQLKEDQISLWRWP